MQNTEKWEYLYWKSEEQVGGTVIQIHSERTTSAFIPRPRAPSLSFSMLHQEKQERSGDKAR